MALAEVSTPTEAVTSDAPSKTEAPEDPRRLAEIFRGVLPLNHSYDNVLATRFRATEPSEPDHKRFETVSSVFLRGSYGASPADGTKQWLLLLKSSSSQAAAQSHGELAIGVETFSPTMKRASAMFTCSNYFRGEALDDRLIDCIEHDARQREATSVEVHTDDVQMRVVLASRGYEPQHREAFADSLVRKAGYALNLAIRDAAKRNVARFNSVDAIGQRLALALEDLVLARGGPQVAIEFDTNISGGGIGTESTTAGRFAIGHMKVTEGKPLAGGSTMREALSRVSIEEWRSMDLGIPGFRIGEFLVGEADWTAFKDIGPEGEADWSDETTIERLDLAPARAVIDVPLP